MQLLKHRYPINYTDINNITIYLAMQVKDLTVDELKSLIRETVIETLDELLPDPDEGKTVQENFKLGLLEIRKRREKGARGISTEDVMNKFGLNS